jgi:hypothetical protein
VTDPKLPGFNAEVAFYRVTNHYGFAATVAGRTGRQAVIPQLPWSWGCLKAQAAADLACLSSGGIVCALYQRIADGYCS